MSLSLYKRNVNIDNTVPSITMDGIHTIDHVRDFSQGTFPIFGALNDSVETGFVDGGRWDSVHVVQACLVGIVHFPHGGKVAFLANDGVFHDNLVGESHFEAVPICHRIQVAFLVSGCSFAAGIEKLELWEKKGYMRQVR